MSNRNNSRLTRWAWTALALAAPSFAQDDQTDRKSPPPIPQPPTANPMPINRSPRPQSLANQPANQPVNRPAAQPPNGSADPTRREVSPDAKRIIDSLATNPEQKAADQREALLLYQQAVAAQQAGRTVDALRFGRRAKQLFPTNQDISNFVAQLQRESGANKLASPSSNRAKAYLAAGYTRGLELMRTGRTGQGEDLLLGVIEASRLFADQSQVDFYRRLAEHELEQFKIAQANGTQPPPANPPAEANAPPPAPEPRAVAAPPENTKRLVRTPDGRVPVWYVTQKTKLAKSMSVDYHNISAAVVLDDIAAKTGVEFVIDRPVALARSHINTLVDFRAADISAEFILDLVAQKAGFEYVLMERAVVVTTRSKALEYLRALPEVLRSNWLVARSLFPEATLDLIAATPAPTPTPPNQTTAAQAAAAARARNLDADVPPHLQSGAALVAAIRVLLK